VTLSERTLGGMVTRGASFGLLKFGLLSIQPVDFPPFEFGLSIFSPIAFPPFDTKYFCQKSK
jgi:hypothetical protein